MSLEQATTDLDAAVASFKAELDTESAALVPLAADVDSKHAAWMDADAAYQAQHQRIESAYAILDKINEVLGLTPPPVPAPANDANPTPPAAA